MDTNLRQSENKAVVEGILSEMKFEKKVGDSKSQHPGVEYITGNLTLKTDELNFTRVGAFSWALAKDEKGNFAKENSIFKGLETVMNEYKTISEVGEDEATKVRITRGDFNFYTTQDGREAVSVKSNFFNRVTDNYDPKSTFEIETYISSMVPEMDKEGEETGRLIVKGWTVAYDGVKPVTLIAPKEDNIASAVESTFEVGQTTRFYGQMINNRVEIVKEIPMAIGPARKEVSYSYKNEFVINGASEAYEEGVSEHTPYEKSAIDLAIQERNNRIDEEEAKKLKGSNPFNNNSTPSGAAKGKQISW